MAGMEGMATTSSASGTDLPPGDATAPAPPGDWYADRIYPQAEMEHSRHDMMKENGAQTIAFISFNLAEYQARKGRDGFRWDGEAWYGDRQSDEEGKSVSGRVDLVGRRIMKK